MVNQIYVSTKIHIKVYADIHKGVMQNHMAQRFTEELVCTLEVFIGPLRSAEPICPKPKWIQIDPSVHSISFALKPDRMKTSQLI